MKHRSDAARIGVVIYDGVEPIDIGGTIGVVSMAQRAPSVAKPPPHWRAWPASA